MGRETKILLGLLATLGGVFLGVLSMKLLVPRPPAGAGPDVTIDHAAGSDTELVEPPAFSPGAFGRTNPEIVAGNPADAIDAAGSVDTGGGVIAPPPAAAAMAGERPLADPPATTAAADGPPANPPPARREDPFVKAANVEFTAEPPAVSQPPVPVSPTVLGGPGLAREAGPAAAPPPPAHSTAARGEQPAAAIYVTRPGDSWWHLAERAYGDGRLYRALFAWNRVLDPRVSLAPGTRLEIPPLSRLEAAWPKLVPAP